MPLYTLDPEERRFLDKMFAEPFLADQITDTDWFRAYQIIETLPDGQLILRAPSRAMARVGVLRGWAAAWVPIEGDDARRLDRALSYRFTAHARDRLAAAVRVGRPVGEALADARGPDMPTEYKRDEQPRDDGGADLALFFDQAGVLLVSVDAAGTILSREILSGPLAFDQIMAPRPVTTKAADAHQALFARTRAEVDLFLRIKQMLVLSVDERREGSRARLTYQVARENKRETVVFTVEEPAVDDPTHLGGGSHSRILDPARLLLFASSVEQDLPADPSSVDTETLRRHATDLALAAESIDEVTKFIPTGHDTVRVEAMKTHAAKRLFERDPARFSRAHLTKAAASLRKDLARYNKLLARRSG